MRCYAPGKKGIGAVPFIIALASERSRKGRIKMQSHKSILFRSKKKSFDRSGASLHFCEEHTAAHGRSRLTGRMRERICAAHRDFGEFFYEEEKR